VAVGTVKSRTCRARRRLAELMGMAQGEPVMSPCVSDGVARRRPAAQTV
jgi:hypothetical protein